MKIRTCLKTIFTIFLVAILMSCTNTGNRDQEKVITVSILPFKYFVGGIAGEDYKINVIVPPGASPATYEPPPSVIRNLQDSELAIFNGYLGFEQAWMDKLMQVNTEIKTLRLADNQELIAAHAHKHGDHFHYEGVDPHFWMSPASAKQMATDIRDFLTHNYPDDSTLFAGNYNDMLIEIEELDTYISDILADIKNRSFLIFHPALSYFARDYNLVQIPIEYEGKEPSASWIGEMIDRARADSIRTIMVQKEFNRSSAETLAEEIDANVVDIYPLSDNWVKALKEVALSIADSRK